MCYVAAVPVITLLLTAAATAYSVDQANQGVKATNKANDIAAEGARQTARDQYSEVNLRVQQEQEAATNAKIENSKRALEAVSTARTASGQAGVSGMSVDNLFADFYRQEAGFRFVTDSNLASTVEQSQRDMKGIRSTGQSRENALHHEPVPGYLGAGLRIGAASVGAYDDYKKRSDPSYT